MVKDVEVVISRETRPLTRAGFGLPLIFTTETNHDYTLYSELEDVGEDFDEADDEYKIASAIFSQSPSPSQIAIYGDDTYTDDVSDLESSLNELVGKRNDWYFLLTPHVEADEIEALAGWAEGQKKLYCFSYWEEDVEDNLELPADIENLEYMRTIGLIHQDYDEDFPAAGWVGRCAPEDPGSITWKFKPIAGLVEADVTTTDVADLHDNGLNTYLDKFGILQTSEGLTTDGDFIDFVRGEDWITARMEEEVFQVISTEDLSYDDRGIAAVGAAIENILQRAFDRGIIAADEDEQPMFEVDLPERSDIPTADIAERNLVDIYWEATLAGRIHSVKPIRGVLTLEEVE